ncbi:tyrosine-type recombinase/integrase [Paracoccus chinensis]|uniref:Site-specific recombinase XerD n=1 Tax=Paracoccus chinensis TaxID=525640 RepID=A0A1G9H886_9RHOB|nr:tyrosine-type recombinase/integrase [Paracoccus chinensis]SDL09092.1 Site-specific recombinase XerD [Paracoccus chinensis]
MKRAERFPHAKSYRDRHGKIRWRYRHKGVTAELGTDWGSEEFCRRYAAAVNGPAKDGAGASRTAPGTLDDLAVRFYKLHLPTVGESTAANYRFVIDRLRVKHGHKRVSHMARRHVIAIKAEMADTPQQANKTLKRLSQLMELAKDLEWRTDNPVDGVKLYPTNPGGFHTWDEGEIARFYEVYEIGSVPHLAMTLMLYTGAAKCDAVKLGRGNIRDGRLVYRRNKTRRNPEGIEVNIPIHPYLAETLAHVPPDAFTFLQTKDGLSRSVKGLGTSMRKWCDKAGLPLCSSHGLRKAICRRIAEAGGTAFAIMSVSGHISLKEAQKYCEEFGRKGMADSAIASLPGGANGEQKLTNHPARFVEKSRKRLQ